MKTIHIDDIRDQLARDDAEDVEARDLFDIFLNGCPGYKNYKDEDCLDWYINKGFFFDGGGWDTEEPVKIATILGQDGQAKFEVFQECQDIYFKLL